VEIPALNLLNSANRERPAVSVNIQRAQRNWKVAIDELLNDQHIASPVYAAPAD
jgi:hypothetical protein